MANPMDGDIPTAVLEETKANLLKAVNAPDDKAFDYVCRAVASFLYACCDH